MVPEFDKAIFTQKIGDIAIVKSSFGYHIVQVEERQAAHTQPLSEVQATIEAALTGEAAAQAEPQYAQQLTAEAIKNGLEKTAAAHHLEVVTTQPVEHAGRDCRAARQFAAFGQGLCKPSRAIRRNPRRRARATPSSR